MFTKKDFAKYPFINEAIKHVEELGINIDELAEEEYAAIIDRARKRIKEGLEYAEVHFEWTNDDIELCSFFAALAIMTFIDDERVKNRYALAESKRANKIFRSENNFEKVLDVAKRTFNWKLRKIESQTSDLLYNYELFFSDYLRNSVTMIDSRWKLVNRTISQGYVYVTREEICRLLQEEVRRKILENLRKKRNEVASLQPIVKEIKNVVLSTQGRIFSKKFKAEKMNIVAFPPCIKSLYENLKSGGNLSHMGRFTLTSFLINIGLDEKKLLKIFKEVMDFDERKTLYQIEHIAGIQGSRTKYVPPKCETLKTHGLCINPDEVCKGMRRPILYYDVKLNRLADEKKSANEINTSQNRKHVK